MTAYRTRPYDPRRDGAHGVIEPFAYAGGIFGQPVNPTSHTGIFEARYAIPKYIEDAETAGGPLIYDSLKADVTQSDPVERNINVPDMGQRIRELYPMPRKRRPARRPRSPLPPPSPPPQLGDETVVFPVAPVGLLSRPVAGPLALIGLGLLIGYAVFAK